MTPVSCPIEESQQHQNSDMSNKTAESVNVKNNQPAANANSTQDRESVNLKVSHTLSIPKVQKEMLIIFS